MNSGSQRDECQELVFPVSREGTHARTKLEFGLLFGLTCVDSLRFVFALRLVYFDIWC